MPQSFSSRMKMGTRKRRPQHFLNDTPSALKLLTKDAAWALWAGKANGFSFPILAARTLPNGMKNDPYLKRVSDDYVLKASDIAGVLNNSNTTVAYISSSVFVGIATVNAAGPFSLSLWTKNGIDLSQTTESNSNNVLFENYVYQMNNQFRTILPLGTTLAQAQAALAGTVIRYQLATPVSLLSANPIVDLVGTVGKNLFDMNDVAAKVGNSSKASTLTDGGYYALQLNTAVRDFYYDFKPNTQYTVSAFCKKTNNGQLSGIFLIIYSDATFSYILLPTSTNYTFQSFTSSAGKTISSIGVTFGDVGNICYYADIQLEEGSAATAYVPHGKANGRLANFGFIPTSGYNYVPVKGVGDLVDYTNLVVNGDFAAGTTGWTNQSGTLSAINKILSATGSGTSRFVGAAQTNQGRMLINKRYFQKVRSRVTNSNCSVLSLWIGGEILSQIISNPAVNQWYELKGIATTLADYSSHIVVEMTYADAATANGKVMEVQEVQAINLTDNPAVQALEAKLGRQLTVAECDSLFTFTPTSSAVRVKTLPGIQGDGSDDVIVLASNAPNPVGQANFAFGLLLKPGANKVKYWLARCDTSDATTQYALKTDVSGNLFVILEGVSIQIGTALSLEIHSIWLERVDGILTVFIDGTQTYSAAHTTALTSRANTTLMAATTGAGTYAGFSNDLLIAIKYASANFVSSKVAWDKFVVSRLSNTYLTVDGYVPVTADNFIYTIRGII